MAIAVPVQAIRLIPDQRTAPPAELIERDQLTRSRLLQSVAHLPGLVVVSFDADWWDGQSHVPCLVVRGGRRGRRLRVVESCGDCVVVPFARRTAQRWLAARRRPPRPELRPGSRRRASDLVLDATGDVRRCESPGCGVLLPIGAVGDCPICRAGRALVQST